MYIRVFLGTILCLLLPVGVAAAEQGRLSVYTVNYPLQYFAQRIAGEHAEVVFPAPADMDPAFWQPTAEVVGGFQRADLILLNGAGYAKWVERAALPRRKLVDTSAAFRDRYIQVDATTTHSHGPGGDHSHAGIAFTTWLDFTQAVEQARAIAEALSGRRPELEKDFMGNFAALEVDLSQLDKQIQKIVAANPNQPMTASHPVYQYFQRRYGLNMHSVMWEPDEVPGMAQWSEFELALNKRPAKWMIWETEPAPEIDKRLRALGVESLIFEPLGNRSDEGDFLSLMQQNLINLRRAFN